MGLGFALLTRGLPLAAIAGAVVCSAQAQRSAFRGGQPILFSSPAGEEVATNTPSLAPRPPESPELQATPEAPVQFDFQRSDANTRLPPPALIPILVETARGQDLLDRRRNWALLTPAEILGVATPEKILGIAGRDAFGRAKGSTALERYTDRQNQLLLQARTNAMQMDNATLSSFFSDKPEDVPDSFYGIRGNLAGPLFNAGPQNYLPGRPNADRSWSKLLPAAQSPNSPSAPSMPGFNPSQTEGMERFRQLLNPGSPGTASSAAPSAGGLKTSLPQSLLSSDLGQPQPSRIGASVAPLSSGIIRPGEMPKLTAAWGLGYTSPPAASVWAPQSAPWLSPGPQPLAPPQRKF